MSRRVGVGEAVRRVGVAHVEQVALVAAGVEWPDEGQSAAAGEQPAIVFRELVEMLGSSRSRVAQLGERPGFVNAIVGLRMGAIRDDAQVRDGAVRIGRTVRVVEQC